MTNGLFWLGNRSVSESSAEINRSPEDVFAYVDDLGKHGEWQEQIVSVHVETDGPTRVGTRATGKPRLPGGARDITYEITAHDPPRTSSFRGVNGPVRPVGTVTVEPEGRGNSDADGRMGCFRRIVWCCCS